MKSLISKISIFSLMILCSMLFINNKVFASEDYDRSEVFIVNDKSVNNVHKVWNIKFSGTVNLNHFINNIQVRDLSSGKIAPVKVVQGDNSYTLKVNPPSKGYEVGHSYQMIINKKNTDQIRNKLKQTTVMNFSVTGNNPGGTSSGSSSGSTNTGSSSSSQETPSSGSYTITGKVLVSTMIPEFKLITLNSTNLKNVSSYSIEGMNGSFDMGKELTLLIAGKTAKITLYDQKGKAIGTTSMDVTSSNNNITMKVSILN